MILSLENAYGLMENALREKTIEFQDSESRQKSDMSVHQM